MIDPFQNNYFAPAAAVNKATATLGFSQVMNPVAIMEIPGTNIAKMK